jgi:aspartate-semialdehyde dehydrogenase
MKKENLTVTILGASGLVGTQLISILRRRSFPIGEMRLCSSPGGDGKKLVIDSETYFAHPFQESVFKDTDIVFFSGPDDMSPQYAPSAISAGAVVIDNSAFFRMKPDVPLIVPEVNGERIVEHHGLIANPNCTTSGLVVALNLIHKKFGLEWITASSYQAISGAGLKAKENFIDGIKKAIESNFETLSALELPFNLIPAVGSFSGGSYFSEEERLIGETRKILGDPTIRIYPTCVRVPVLNVHAISAVFETRKPFRDGEIELILADSPGLEVVDDPINRIFPTPVGADGLDQVQVGRIRKFEENRAGFWVIADNLRKGAALNAVQIAELLLKHSI